MYLEHGTEIGYLTQILSQTLVEMTLIPAKAGAKDLKVGDTVQFFTEIPANYLLGTVHSRSGDKAFATLFGVYTARIGDARDVFTQGFTVGMGKDVVGVLLGTDGAYTVNPVIGAECFCDKDLQIKERP